MGVSYPDPNKLDAYAALWEQMDRDLVALSTAVKDSPTKTTWTGKAHTYFTDVSKEVSAQVVKVAEMVREIAKNIRDFASEVRKELQKQLVLTIVQAILGVLGLAGLMLSVIPRLAALLASIFNFLSRVIATLLSFGGRVIPNVAGAAAPFLNGIGIGAVLGAGSVAVAHKITSDITNTPYEVPPLEIILGTVIGGATGGLMPGGKVAPWKIGGGGPKPKPIVAPKGISSNQPGGGAHPTGGPGGKGSSVVDVPVGSGPAGAKKVGAPPEGRPGKINGAVVTPNGRDGISPGGPVKPVPTPAEGGPAGGGRNVSGNHELGPVGGKPSQPPPAHSSPDGGTIQHPPANGGEPAASAHPQPQAAGGGLRQPAGNHGQGLADGAGQAVPHKLQPGNGADGQGTPVKPHAGEAGSAQGAPFKVQPGGAGGQGGAVKPQPGADGQGAPVKPQGSDGVGGQGGPLRPHAGEAGSAQGAPFKVQPGGTAGQGGAVKVQPGPGDHNAPVKPPSPRPASLDVNPAAKTAPEGGAHPKIGTPGGKAAQPTGRQGPPEASAAPSPVREGQLGDQVHPQGNATKPPAAGPGKVQTTVNTLAAKPPGLPGRGDQPSGDGLPIGGRKPSVDIHPGRAAGADSTVGSEPVVRGPVVGGSGERLWVADGKGRVWAKGAEPEFDPAVRPESAYERFGSVGAEPVVRGPVVGGSGERLWVADGKGRVWAKGAEPEFDPAVRPESAYERFGSVGAEPVVRGPAVSGSGERLWVADGKGRVWAKGAQPEFDPAVRPQSAYDRFGSAGPEPVVRAPAVGGSGERLWIADGKGRVWAKGAQPEFDPAIRPESAYERFGAAGPEPVVRGPAVGGSGERLWVADGKGRVWAKGAEPAFDPAVRPQSAYDRFGSAGPEPAVRGPAVGGSGERLWVADGKGRVWAKGAQPEFDPAVRPQSAYDRFGSAGSEPIVRGPAADGAAAPPAGLPSKAVPGRQLIRIDESGNAELIRVTKANFTGVGRPLGRQDGMPDRGAEAVGNPGTASGKPEYRYVHLRPDGEMSPTALHTGERVMEARPLSGKESGGHDFAAFKDGRQLPTGGSRERILAYDPKQRAWEVTPVGKAGAPGPAVETKPPLQVLRRDANGNVDLLTFKRPGGADRGLPKSGPDDAKYHALDPDGVQGWRPGSGAGEFTVQRVAGGGRLNGAAPRSGPEPTSLIVKDQVTNRWVPLAKGTASQSAEGPASTGPRTYRWSPELRTVEPAPVRGNVLDVVEVGSATGKVSFSRYGATGGPGAGMASLRVGPDGALQHADARPIGAGDLKYDPRTGTIKMESATSGPAAGGGAGGGDHRPGGAGGGAGGKGGGLAGRRTADGATTMTQSDDGIAFVRLKPQGEGTDTAASLGTKPPAAHDPTGPSAKAPPTKLPPAKASTVTETSTPTAGTPARELGWTGKGYEVPIGELPAGVNVRPAGHTLIVHRGPEPVSFVPTLRPPDDGLLILVDQSVNNPRDVHGLIAAIPPEHRRDVVVQFLGNRQPIDPARARDITDRALGGLADQVGTAAVHFPSSALSEPPAQNPRQIPVNHSGDPAFASVAAGYRFHPSDRPAPPASAPYGLRPGQRPDTYESDAGLHWDAGVTGIRVGHRLPPAEPPAGAANESVPIVVGEPGDVFSRGDMAEIQRVQEEIRRDGQQVPIVQLGRALNDHGQAQLDAVRDALPPGWQADPVPAGWLVGPAGQTLGDPGPITLLPPVPGVRVLLVDPAGADPETVADILAALPPTLRERVVVQPVPSVRLSWPAVESVVGLLPGGAALPVAIVTRAQVAGLPPASATHVVPMAWTPAGPVRTVPQSADHFRVYRPGATTPEPLPAGLTPDQRPGRFGVDRAGLDGWVVDTTDPNTLRIHPAGTKPIAPVAPKTPGAVSVEITGPAGQEQLAELFDVVESLGAGRPLEVTVDGHPGGLRALENAAINRRLPAGHAAYPLPAGHLIAPDTKQPVPPADAASVAASPGATLIELADGVPVSQVLVSLPSAIRDRAVVHRSGEPPLPAAWVPTYLRDRRWPAAGGGTPQWSGQQRAAVRQAATSLAVARAHVAQVRPQQQLPSVSAFSPAEAGRAIQLANLGHGAAAADHLGAAYVSAAHASFREMLRDLGLDVPAPEVHLGGGAGASLQHHANTAVVEAVRLTLAGDLDRARLLIQQNRTALAGQDRVHWVLWMRELVSEQPERADDFTKLVQEVADC